MKIFLYKACCKWYNRPALNAHRLFEYKKRLLRKESRKEECFSYADGESPIPCCCHFLCSLETAWVSFGPPIRSLFRAATHTHSTLSRQLRFYKRQPATTTTLTTLHGSCLWVQPSDLGLSLSAGPLCADLPSRAGV